MFALLMSGEAWLNATNALLGIVVFACVIAIGGVMFHDIANRIRARARERGHFVYDQHAMHVPELGLTMADGGEPTDEKETGK
jgi:hypothetical protein